MSVVVEVASRSLSLGLAGLFALAVAHKVFVLRAGTASAQPLLRHVGLHGKHAAAVLAASAGVETAIAGTLVAEPAVGYLAAASLLLFYTWELRGLAADESCGCFGHLLEVRTRSAAIWRNIALAAAALLAGVAYLTGVVAVASLSQVTVGVALLIASVTVAAALLHREAAVARGH